MEYWESSFANLDLVFNMLVICNTLCEVTFTFINSGDPSRRFHYESRLIGKNSYSATKPSLSICARRHLFKRHFPHFVITANFTTNCFQNIWRLFMKVGTISFLTDIFHFRFSLPQVTEINCRPPGNVQGNTKPSIHVTDEQAVLSNWNTSSYLDDFHNFSESLT